jgi:hypothetical protein
MTTDSKKIRALIERLSPEPICDDCITERLGLPDPEHADRTSRELAGSRGFERRRDECSICRASTLVIRYRPK